MISRLIALSLSLSIYIYIYLSFSLSLYMYIYIYMHLCVCVCVCVFPLDHKFCVNFEPNLRGIIDELCNFIGDCKKEKSLTLQCFGSEIVAKLQTNLKTNE